jgi:hypothetical protein
VSTKRKNRSGAIYEYKNEIAPPPTEVESSAISDSDKPPKRFRGMATSACTRGLLPDLYTGHEDWRSALSGQHPIHSRRYKPLRRVSAVPIGFCCGGCPPPPVTFPATRLDEAEASQATSAPVSAVPFRKSATRFYPSSSGENFSTFPLAKPFGFNVRRQ